MSHAHTHQWAIHTHQWAIHTHSEPCTHTQWAIHTHQWAIHTHQWAIHTHTVSHTHTQWVECIIHCTIQPTEEQRAIWFGNNGSHLCAIPKCTSEGHKVYWYTVACKFKPWSLTVQKTVLCGWTFLRKGLLQYSQCTLKPSKMDTIGNFTVCLKHL